jgi:hypothetical protein
MSQHDIPGLVLFGIIGFVSGLLSAHIFRRSRRPYRWTALCAIPIATLVTVVLLFFVEVTNALSFSDSLPRAIQEIVRSSLIVAAVAPFACGGPAMLFGLVSQCVLRRQKVSG